MTPTCGRVAAGVAIALAVGLPFTTLIRLTAPTPQAAMELTPLALLMSGGLVLAAILIGGDDPWLAALAGWMVIRATWTPLAHAYTAATWIVVGLAVIAAARRTPGRWRGAVAGALVAVGLIEAALAILQEWARCDPYAMGWAFCGREAQYWAHGTLGNRGYLGMLLAIVAPLGPAWTLLILVPGLAASHSVTAAAAAWVGLVLRYRRCRWAVACLTAVPVVVLAHRGLDVLSTLERASLWGWTLDTLRGWPLLVGHGPGAWMAIAIEYQRQIGAPAVIGSALHNEPLQLAFEGGLVALGLLAGWCWAHRRAVWVDRWGAALAAAGVACLAWFPLRLGAVAAIVLVIVGMATGDAPRAARREGAQE